MAGSVDLKFGTSHFFVVHLGGVSLKKKRCLMLSKHPKTPVDFFLGGSWLEKVTTASGFQGGIQIQVQPLQLWENYLRLQKSSDQIQAPNLHQGRIFHQKILWATLKPGKFNQKPPPFFVCFLLAFPNLLKIFLQKIRRWPQIFEKNWSSCHILA